MAIISSAIIKALVDNYTREELRAWQSAGITAVMNNLPRVEVTGANFEMGGSSGEFVGGDPQQVVELTTAAIEWIDAEAKTNDRQASADFSRRRVGW